MKLNNVTISGSVTLVSGLAGAPAIPNDPSTTGTSTTGTSTTGTSTGSSIPPVVTPPASTYAYDLEFEGADGSTSFVDTAYMARTFTLSGTPHISTAQSASGTSSLALDGSSGLSVGASSDPQTLGNGDFTVEVAFFEQSNFNNPQMLMSRWGRDAEFEFYLDYGDLSFNMTDTQGNNHKLRVSVSTCGFVTGRWFSVAACRNGGMVYVYVNGLIAQAISMPAIGLHPNTSDALCIGRYDNGGYPFGPGYIDRATITLSAKYGAQAYPVGSTTYTAPAPAPQPATTVTPLVMHFEGADGSASFVDSATPSRFVTPIFAPVISTDQAFSGSSSLKLDGRSYLMLGSALDAGPSLGNGDFTVEIAFFMQSSLNGVQMLISRWGNDEEFLFYLDYGDLSFNMNDTQGNNHKLRVSVSTCGFVTGRWFSVAACRNGSMIYIYVNGLVAQAISMPAVGLHANSADALCIGVQSNGSYAFGPGYLDEATITLSAKYGAQAYPVGSTTYTAPAAAPAPVTTVTPLAMHFEGADGSASFVDSATPSRFVTPIFAPVISTDQALTGSSSLKLDGRSYLYLGSSLDAGPLLGNGDFTVEIAFYNTGNFNGTQALISRWGSEFLLFLLGSELELRVVDVQGNTTQVNASFPFARNQWYRVAACRNGPMLYLYVDGLVQAATPMNSTALQVHMSDALCIGGQDGNQNVFGPGYLDEAAITLFAKYGAQAYPVGSTTYTAPAPAPQPATTVTPVAMHFEGADGSASFVDSATPSRFITPIGSPVISTDQALSGSSSLKLDGRSYLMLGSALDAGPSLGTGDFTIEAAFFYVSAVSGSPQAFVSRWGRGQEFLLFVNNSTTMTARVNDTNGNTTQLQNNVYIPLNTWNQIALCRSGTTLALYFAGKMIANGQFIGQPPANLSDALCVGGQDGSGAVFQGGYIDEVMLTYTAKYGLSGYMVAGAVAAPATTPSTTFLMHFDGADGGTSFADAVNPGRTFTPMGTATIGTAQSLFGGASLNLSHDASSYLVTSAVAGVNEIGNADFTIEAAIYFLTNPTGNYQAIVTRWNSNTKTQFILAVRGGSLTLVLRDTNNNQYAPSGNFTFQAGQWYQVAACRKGSNVMLFCNGLLIGMGDFPGALADPGSVPLCVGAQYDPAAQIGEAFIDEVRICQTALYSTSGYTPATQAYTDTSTA